MPSNIKPVPDYLVRNFRTERIVTLEVAGAYFTVLWEAEPGDEAPDGTFDPAVCWVEAVRFGEAWFGADDVLTPGLLDAMHAELIKLDELEGCAA